MEALLLVRPYESANASLHASTLVPDVGNMLTKSAQLDVGSSDHLGPLLGFIADKLTEISWRAREHNAAHVDEPSLHREATKGSVDLDIEFLNYRWRHAPGCNEPNPLASLETRNELTEGWNVW